MPNEFLEDAGLGGPVLQPRSHLCRPEELPARTGAGQGGHLPHHQAAALGPWGDPVQVL